MPLVKKEAKQSHENMIHLTDRQQLLINLQTDTAVVKKIHENNQLLGTVVQNEKQVQVISARVPGRIEKLFLRTPGETVKKGQLLYSLYSEELLAAQTDFVQAIEQAENFKNQKDILEQLIEAARNKLLLWGVTEKQIQTLASSKKASPYTNYYSHSSGYLSDLKIREGAYVEQGTPLFEIADLGDLWIEAQVYPREFTLVRQNPAVTVEFEAFPGKEYAASLVFSAPALEENQKIGLVRFAIRNPDEKIKPGMMAYVRVSQGGKEALVIPKSAILLEQMKVVWVESEKGMFERRMVTTGVENKREVEILSGIEAGEKVVSSGVYLLNSEFILQQGGTQAHNH
jgi:Cu(I)/Ag(I) efflux system membrane fusion protein